MNATPPAGDTALWLRARQGAWEAGPAPALTVGPNEIVIRNRAIAVNPVDRLIPSLGGLIAPWLKYPIVLGSDVAGEVEAVGSAVSRFKVGDRVLGHAAVLEKSRNRAAEGAFQRRTVLLEHMAAPLPPDMSYEEGAVLPLGVSTAACCLFEAEHLALRFPTSNKGPTGETVLVWGASTSVGSNAVQLAVAAGYEVVATASPHNFDYVRRLGAGDVLDYRSPAVVSDLRRRLATRQLAGAVAIGAWSSQPCINIAASCAGARRVAVVTPGGALDVAPTGWKRAPWLAANLPRMGWSMASFRLKARLSGVSAKLVWGGALVDDAVGPMIYADYLPGALRDGRHRAAPSPLVVGSGVAAIPGALDRLGAGVSARKIVVTL